jgi:hypothetical protein
MTNLSRWIQRLSNGRVALISLIIFLAFTAFILPEQASQARLSTGYDSSPDLSFFYTSDSLYNFAEVYGEEGRAAYVKARFTFDIIWPFVYMVFLSTAISWLFQGIFKDGSIWQLSNLVPIGGMILDYLENISTSIVMIRYPNPSGVIAIVAPVFTSLKWIFVGGGFILLLLGLVIRVIKSLAKK